MRLDRTRRTEWFGAVRLHESQRVIELDSGSVGASAASVRGLGHPLATKALAATARQMAIVVPCRNETVRAIEGVLSGIPHECLVIVVSASARQPVDRFEMEGEAVRAFCEYAQRSALVMHQHDPGLASALVAAGASELVGGDGVVRAGKGEAMIVGLAIVAALTDRPYVGYVDVDNLVPGAVNEYCRAYAAGLLLADTPYAMVRVEWQSKPKVRDGRIFFNRRGRASEVSNRFLNQLIGEYGGFGTDVVTTGSAGDHALSVALALRLRFAGGFAAETYELLDMFEQFGGVLEPRHPDVMAKSVSVRQVVTRSPHFHQDKGEDHVDGLWLEALSAIYHSRLCPPAVRADIAAFLIERGLLRPGQEPPKVPVYSPVGSLALDRLRGLLDDAGAVRRYGVRQPVVPPRHQRRASR